MKVNYRRKNPKNATPKVNHDFMKFIGKDKSFVAQTSIGHFFLGGSKGERQAVKGAKQYIRHELRRHSKRVEKAEMKEFHDDEQKISAT